MADLGYGAYTQDVGLFVEEYNGDFVGLECHCRQATIYRFDEVGGVGIIIETGGQLAVIYVQRSVIGPSVIT